MTIVKKETVHRKMDILLDGPDGNAFVLLGYAAKFAKKLSLDEETIQKEMTSGDYENLVNVFDKYFGEYVNLIR